MPPLPAFALLGALLVATAAPFAFAAPSGSSGAGVGDVTDLNVAATRSGDTLPSPTSPSSLPYTSRGYLLVPRSDANTRASMQ